MMRRRLLFWVLLCVGFLAFGGMTVFAAGPDEAPAAAPVAAVELTVQPTGQWSVSLGGMDLGIDSTNFDSLAKQFGLNVMAPVIRPDLVTMAMDNDIQHLALIKDGPTTTVWVNSQPLTSLTIADAALEAINDFLPQLERLLPQIKAASFSVVVHFPPKDAGQIYVFDTTGGMKAQAAAAEPVNNVIVDATISPDGRPLSVGGLSFEKLGMQMGAIDLSFVQQLGISELDLAVDGTGISVGANAEEWLRLDLNTDYLMQSAPQIANLLALQNNQQINDLAAGWLKDTRLTFAAHISDQSVDKAPAISIGRPLMVEVGADNSLSVEGINTYTALDPQMAGYIKQFGSLGVAWDGTTGQLHLATGDALLPYIQLDKGFLPVVTSLLPAGLVNGPMAESVLMNSKFTVNVIADGKPAPKVEALTYQAVDVRKPAVSIVPQITVGPNSVAVYGESLPLNLIKSLAGFDLMQMINQYRTPLGEQIQTLGVYLAPDGIRINVNGANTRILWTDESRASMVDLGFELAGSQLNLPAIATSPLARTAITALLSNIELGVEINMAAQDAAPGVLQTVAYWVFPES